MSQHTTQRRIPRLALLLGLVALLIGGGSASAGGFTLFGSYWDTDALGDTIGAGFLLAIPLGESQWDIDLRATYFEDLEDQSFDDFIDDVFDDDENPVVKNSIRIIPLEAGLKYNFASEEVFNFYLGGGGGYYLLDNTGFNIDDEFGFYAVAGLTIGASDGIAFAAEVIYRKIEGSVDNDPSNIDDIDDLGGNNRIGLDLDGVGANVGIIWRW